MAALSLSTETWRSLWQAPEQTPSTISLAKVEVSDGCDRSNWDEMTVEMLREELPVDPKLLSSCGEKNLEIKMLYFPYTGMQTLSSHLGIGRLGRSGCGVRQSLRWVSVTSSSSSPKESLRAILSKALDTS